MYGLEGNTNFTEVCNHIESMNISTRIFTKLDEAKEYKFIEVEKAKRLLLSIKVFRPLIAMQGFPKEVRAILLPLVQLGNTSLDNLDMESIVGRKEIIQAVKDMEINHTAQLFDGMLTPWHTRPIEGKISLKYKEKQYLDL